MPLFHCKYKGFMPLFQDLRLHKLPFFQFSNSIQMHALDILSIYLTILLLSVQKYYLLYIT